MNESSTKRSSKTNWEKLGHKTDEEIDFSDSPELSAEFFASATLQKPAPGPHSFRVFRTDPATGEEITVREWTGDADADADASQHAPTSLTLQVEAETLAWFRAQDDAENKMRAALRLYALAHQ